LSMSVLCLKFHVFRDTVQQVEVLIQLRGELLREQCQRGVRGGSLECLLQVIKGGVGQPHTRGSGVEGRLKHRSVATQSTVRGEC